MDIQTLLPFFFKFLRFAVVGASGVVIDFGLTYLIREKLKLNEYVANGVGFFAAATNNFFINRAWTFSSQDPEMLTQYSRFIFFALIGLAINSAIVWFLHGQKGRNFYVSKAIATVIVIIWNFFSNFFFTFR
jgi:putative flippase GtrA